MTIKKIRLVLLNLIIYSILVNSLLMIVVLSNDIFLDNNRKNCIMTSYSLDNNILVRKWPIFHSLGDYNDIEIKDGYAFISAMHGGLLIFDVNNPDRITFINKYEEQSRINSIDIQGDIAYLSSEANGILIINISDPRNLI
ncbi:MAG: hypothetical protein ACTSRP_21310, partial [Candidatus Helarchaeota archaeon]